MMWQSHMAAAVPGMLALAGMGPGGVLLPDDIRRLAAEFVFTLIDIKPQIVQVRHDVPYGRLKAKYEGTRGESLDIGWSSTTAWT
jgi:hypothetical protein